MAIRFEHLRQRQAKSWELMGPSPREQGMRNVTPRAAAFASSASDFTLQALRELPRPGNDNSAAGSLRHKAIAQVLPPYMIEHDEMVARQRRSKAQAARAVARSVKKQREHVAATKTRN